MGWLRSAGSALAVAAVIVCVCRADCSPSARRSGYVRSGGTIGIAMPEQSAGRWLRDAQAIGSHLRESGFEYDIQYANNDAARQIKQLTSMIQKNCRALVVAAVAGDSLDEVLRRADDKRIPVIAYDRRIEHSRHVRQFVTFDSDKTGRMQARSLLTGMGVGTNTPTPDGRIRRIAIFAGDPGDSNARELYNGAKAVLDHSPNVTIVHGENGFESAAVPGWRESTAREKMSSLLNDGGDGQFDGILAANDQLAAGVRQALLDKGYGTGDQPFPVITGQDAQIAAVEAVIADRQYSTVFKDIRTLGHAAADAVARILNGEPPKAAVPSDHSGGSCVVSTCVYETVLVDKSNYWGVLVDSGYYTPRQLGR